MNRFTLFVMFAVLAVVPAVAGENVRERLKMLEGPWTVEGKEATFRETCQWFWGRSHLVCDSESQGKSGFRRGISVMSYSDQKRHFLYYHYGSSGLVQALDLFTDGTTLAATGERASGSNLVRTQVSVTPRNDGTFDFREEESTNGGPWKVTAQVHYIRLASAAKGK